MKDNEITQLLSTLAPEPEELRVCAQVRKSDNEKMLAVSFTGGESDWIDVPFEVIQSVDVFLAKEGGKKSLTGSAFVTFNERLSADPKFCIRLIQAIIAKYRRIGNLEARSDAEDDKGACCDDCEESGSTGGSAGAKPIARFGTAWAKVRCHKTGRVATGGATDHRCDKQSLMLIALNNAKRNAGCPRYFADYDLLDGDYNCETIIIDRHPRP